MACSFSVLFLLCVVTPHTLYRRRLGRPADSLDAIPASVAYLAPSCPGHCSAGHIGLGSPDEQLCPHCWLCGGIPGMLHWSAEQTSESAAGFDLHCLKERVCCLPTMAEFRRALLSRVPLFCAMLDQQKWQQSACTHVHAVMHMSSEGLQFLQLCFADITPLLLDLKSIWSIAAG